MSKLITAMALATASTALSASDLIISEYIEGSSNNKAVELYNTSTADIDLTGYRLQFFFNGSVTPGYTLDLSGIVPSGSVFVAAHSSANGDILAAANQVSGGGWFNGDDAILLIAPDDAIEDSIGQIGVDPGSEWGTGDTSTQDNTLQRIDLIADTDPTDSFDPATHYTGLAKDTFAGLGATDLGDGNTDGGGNDGGDNGGDEPGAIGACFATSTPGFHFIHAVQGAADASPLTGSSVVVEGVVTGLREKGFFLQEEIADEDNNANTSEGIFVFSNEPVIAGQVVRVAGDVAEYFGMTQISNVAAVADCATTASVSTTAINFPLPENTDLEYVEGMMVSVANMTVTGSANLWKYGELVLSHELKRQPSDKYAPLSPEYLALEAANAKNVLMIEDMLDAKYPPELSFYPGFAYADAIRIGDTLSATGPLNYAFNQFRINPVTPVTVASTRELAPTLTQGNLSIATFNVLNYFNGQPTTNGDVTFDYPENRGAATQAQFDLQQARIVEAIRTLNADVVGLMEIENDGFDSTSAIQSLVTAVNATLPTADQYQFIATADGSPVGSDAIAVGLLYRPEIVTPNGAAGTIDMPTQQMTDGSMQAMRTALLQTFTHTESNQDFAVVVNHFKSKGSGCYEDANTPSATDQIQGSCNALRVSAAVTLGEALESASLPERVMILGDLNAYSAEDPLAVLTDYTPEERGYTIQTAERTNRDDGESVPVTQTYGFKNVAETFDEEGFSYWFYGNGLIGSLDHILANPVFFNDIVDAKHWNINAPEAFQLQYDQALKYYPDANGYAFSDVGPFRSSDHDPFIVSLYLEAASLKGDFNQDGMVNRDDLYQLYALFNQTVPADHEMDLNGDQKINILDLRALVGLCTNPGCR